MRECYSMDYVRKILKCVRTSDDGKVQSLYEFVDKKEFDDLTKQLDYVNKKVKNRDVMVEKLRQDCEYFRQQLEVYKKLHEEDQKHDKIEALKGTIRGLEKTKDKLNSEVNRLKKKLVKAEQRSAKIKEVDHLPIHLTLEIELPYDDYGKYYYNKTVTINNCGYNIAAYNITGVEVINLYKCKLYLELDARKTVERSERDERKTENKV